MSENSCSLDFYNMLVHIVFKNRVSEENVAVKNAWEKNGTLFFDLYFYRAKRGKLLDALIGFAAFTKNQTGVPRTFNRTVRTFVCRTGITQIRTAWRVHAFFRRRPGVKGEQSLSLIHI